MKGKLIISLLLMALLLTTFVGCAEPAAFSLSNLTIEPKVSPNEIVHISVSVTNTGGSQGSHDIVLEINGVEEDNKSITLAAGEGKDITFMVAKGDAGTYSVTIEDLSGSFSVAEPANFSVSNLTIEPSVVSLGEQVTISATVTNTGGSEGSCDVVLYIDGSEEETKSITLAAGESGNVTFSVVREDIGNYDVIIRNVFGSFRVVEPANLLISSIEFEPYHVVWPNEEVIISVFVRNNSDIEGSRDVVLYIDGVEEETKSITLAAHELGSIAFSVSREDIGIYKVAIEGISAYFGVATPLSIKLEVTASTWRDGEEPFDIYGEIEGKLKNMGIRIVEEGDPYDGLLSVDYQESMHGLYTNYQYGTHIWCVLSLYNSAGKLITTKIITGETPSTVSLATWESLYSKAVTDFKLKDSYKSLGPIIAWNLRSEYVFLKLISDLKDSNPLTRESAVIAFGEIRYDVRAVEPLLPLLLGDSSNNVRSSAAKALGNIRDVRAIEPLIHALLEDNYSSVRINAAEALGKIGDVRAIDALTQASLEDDNADVRDMAEWALKQIQG